jgi:hypothetical protein
VTNGAGTVVGSVGAAAGSVEAHPATWAIITNTHATQTLTWAIGDTAVEGDHAALAAGASSPAIPLANTGQLSVVGSAADTTYAVAWTLDV